MRDLIKQPLGVKELEALARRVGGAGELVKPINKGEVEGMKDAEIIRYLAGNPNSVRRPIIDTGNKVTLGFSASARAELGGEPQGKKKR